LEEIGIAKGHALKIVVSLRRMLEARDPANRKLLENVNNAHCQPLVVDKQREEKEDKLL
jgi:hypothetical protein